LFEVLGVPNEMLKMFIWSWSTAAFYFTAIFGALAVRDARVAGREWFDLNNLDRARPFPQYITPTLVGTALGYATLCTIALIGGPGFKASFSDLNELVAGTLPWLPLATVMASIALVLSDCPAKQDSFLRDALGRAACGALVMAVVGFLTSRLSIMIPIDNFAILHPEMSSKVRTAGEYLCMFTAMQIGVLAFVLCMVVQLAEFYAVTGRSIAGKYIDVVTRQGPRFVIFLDPAGPALLFTPGPEGAAREPISRGQWQQFPEGMAVKWNAHTTESRCNTGDFGLISSYGDSLIYEGFVDQFSRTADFTAQARLRANGNYAAGQVRRPAKVGASRASGLQDGPVGLKPAPQVWVEEHVT
jgi:hypothetical protein